MLKALKRIDAKTPEVRALQDAVADALKDVGASRILDGKLISDIALAASTPLSINHGLERSPKWLVVRRNANALVWDGQDTNQSPARTLILTASAAVTVDLWVF